MADRNYEQGLRNGKTEASFAGIASSLDELRNEVRALPCIQHAKSISATATATKIQWALLVLILTGILGLAWGIFQGVFK